MIGRLGELADRPLGERERHGLFALAIGVIVCAAALLLTMPPDPPVLRPGAVPRSAAPAADRAAPPMPRNVSGEVESTARRFLRGYIRWLYGRGAASAIGATSDRLRHRLVRTELRVPPAALRRHPRVIDLDVQPVRRRRFAVTAEVDDGSRARYPIQLTVSRDHGRWRVSEVADH